MIITVYLAVIIQITQPYKIKYIHHETQMVDLTECVEMMVTFYEHPYVISENEKVIEAECKIRKEKPAPKIDKIIQLPPKERV